MAGINPPESTLSAALRLVTAMLNEYDIDAMNAEPINCPLLEEMIQAAQRIYTRHCPIANGPE